MAGKLKRVSPPTAEVIEAIAATEGRSFVTQLDRIVYAGLTALGYDLPDGAEAPTPTTQVA